MRAKTIDGQALARERLAALCQRVEAMRGRGIVPCLAAVSVAEDHGWKVYSARQAKDCAGVGIAYRPVHINAAGGQAALDEEIEALNADAGVHGIIVQAPLPPPFDLCRAQSLLAPAKDVEAVTPANLGLVMSGRALIAPCTARSAHCLARHALGDLKGVETVVVGASVIVGRPLAQLLVNDLATVSITHIDTRDVKAHTRTADLLIVAAGKAGLVKADWVKPGATVIDVGINRITTVDGGKRTVGDVAEEVWEVAGAVSPVPGGVGALTTSFLLEHAVEASERAADRAHLVTGGMITHVLAKEGIALGQEAAGRVAELLSSHIALGRQRPPDRRGTGPS